MKTRLLIAFVATCTLLGGCIIADLYSGGSGQEEHGGYGHPHGDRGRYGNDHVRDRNRDREQDYRRE